MTRTLALLSIFLALPAGAAQPFAPVDLTVDLRKLSVKEKQILRKLVDASKIMDALFLRQVWAGNETMLLSLAGKPQLDGFLLNKGPWDRLQKNQPFVAGAPPKPAEANFYPAGATKAEG